MIIGSTSSDLSHAQISSIFFIPSEEGNEEVKMNGNSDELCVNQGNVDPAVRDHPSIGVGNTSQVILKFFVEDIRLDEALGHRVTENVSRPLDWIPGDLMTVFCDLV